MKPAIHIHILVDDTRWRAVDGVARLVRRAARAALRRQASGLRAAELSVVLASDARLRALNRAWRGIDRPTNVLAFPGDDALAGAAPHGPPRQLGDVVVAYQTVAAEARAQGKPLAAHVSHLVVHGVLHVLGFDHESAAEAADMEAAEIAIMAELGWPDPYRAAPRRRVRARIRSRSPSGRRSRGARAIARVA
jgi:probable rRNA maturation factor